MTQARKFYLAGLPAVFGSLLSHGMITLVIFRAADEVAILIHAVAMALALLVVPEIAVPAWHAFPPVTIVINNGSQAILFVPPFRALSP